MTLTFIITFENKPNQLVIADKLRFTSSKNYDTSTLTVTFYNPTKIISYELLKENVIKHIYLSNNEIKLLTKDIEIVWLKGQPMYLEAIFLITSEKESLKIKKLFSNISKK